MDALTLQHAARVEVDATEYDFGSLSLGAKGQRRFVFRNVGHSPLRLTAGATSCKCAVSAVDDEEVAPGAEAGVLVTWKGEGESGAYRQTATILTNDPLRPRVVLTVSGRITVAARRRPEELILTRVSADEPTTGQVVLYGYLQEPLEVTKTELLDAATAEHFAVASRPLTTDELKDERDARSGVAVLVTVKPGLPQGGFQQTIRLATSYASAPTFDIPVRGTVTSDIAIAGQGWDSEHGVVVLGTIERDQGAQRRLLLMVRGPHRQDVTFRTVEVVPDVLQVTVGETKAINNAAVYHTPLMIMIPKGSRRVQLPRPGQRRLWPHRARDHASEGEQAKHPRVLRGGRLIVGRRANKASRKSGTPVCANCKSAKRIAN